jgi:SMI1 / KNR4 family (SUKH-1)
MVAALPTAPEEWREYLTEYSHAYFSVATEDDLEALDEQQIAARWLGYEPAREQMLAETEERLGVRLPPSLRGFLRTSNGWTRVADWVERLCPCRDIEWFIETDKGAAFFEGARSVATADPDEQDFVELLRHGLTVACGEGDVWFLDTRNAADGEYEGYHLVLSDGEIYDPYPTFSALFASGRQEIEEGRAESNG